MADVNKKVAKAQIKAAEAQTRYTELESKTLQQRLKETSDKAHEKIEGYGGLPLLFLIFGVVFHAVHWRQNRWDDISVTMIIVASVLALFVIPMSFVSSRERGVKTLMFFAAAIGFEIIYYTLITSVLLDVIPTLDKKFFWNGFFVVGIISWSLSKEKWYYKIPVWYFIILLVYPLVAPFVKALATTVGFIKTTEVGERKGIIEGVGELTVKTTDTIICSWTYPGDREQQRECEEERKWKGAEPEQIKAMKDICTMDMTRCECHAYESGKEREDCLERKSKATAREIRGTAKGLTPMKMEFEAPKRSESLTKTVRLDPVFKVLSPYKAIDVVLNCEIYDRTGEISSLMEIEEGPITVPPKPLEQSIRFSCKSKEEVPAGDYTFNLTASVRNIKTKSTFIGIYSHPLSIGSYADGTYPMFGVLLEAEMETAYPSGEVESRPDPDLTQLLLGVEPLRSLGVKGVSGLSREGKNNKFVLLVSLENEKAGSAIRSVESLEFKIPQIFTPNCPNVYTTGGFEGDFVKISARKDVLNKIDFKRIKPGSKPTPISDLSCDLIANRDLEKPDVPTSLDFEGSIIYSQDFTQQFMVKRVG